MKSSSASALLQVESMFLYAQYNMEVSNFGRALRLFKQAKSMAVVKDLAAQRMRAYMSLGAAC